MEQPQQEQQRARWRGLLAEQQESSQSIVAFCRERGLREWQFYEWKKRLRPPAASFVAVQLAAEPAPAAAPVTSAPVTPLEVRLRNGRSVLVGPDFDATHLRRLLQALESDA